MKSSRKENEGKFRYLPIMADYVTEAIGIFDPQGKLLFANTALERMMGWKMRDLIGRNAFYKIHSDDRNRAFEQLQHLIETEKDVIQQIRFKTKKGDYIWVEASGNAVRDKKTGEPTYIVVSGRDISKRKEAEAALQASEQVYRAMLDKSPDATLIRDEHGKIIDANPQATQLFGYSKKELIGKKLLHLYPPEEHDRLKNSFNKLKQTKRTREGDFTIVTKDKQRVCVDVNASCFNVGDKVLIKSIFRDITEQKKLQEELRKAKKELEAVVVERTMELMQANTALKVLLSHQNKEKVENEEKLSTNLRNQILPYIQELKKGSLNDKHTACIRLLEKNLQGIMSEFVTQLKSSTSNLTPKEIQVSSLIKEGMSTREIARFLNVSRKTVDVFRYNIRKKLGLNNRRENLMSHLLSL